MNELGDLAVPAPAQGGKAGSVCTLNTNLANLATVNYSGLQQFAAQFCYASTFRPLPRRPSPPFTP
jgi:hypothetical protein